MALVRLLYFYATHYHIYICVRHISCNNTNIADATCVRISHFQDTHFRRLALDAATTPEKILAWPTQAFTMASCSSGIMVSPNQHIGHTS